MAKDKGQNAAWKQNTEIRFTIGDRTYRVVDFHEEMTARQDEDLLALVGDILPAVLAMDEDNTLLALKMLVDAVVSEKALARHILAILFLPENGDRVYRKADVAERIELIGDLPNRQLFPLFEAISDFFVFVGQKFPSVSGTFLGMTKTRTTAG